MRAALSSLSAIGACVDGCCKGLRGIMFGSGMKNAEMTFQRNAGTS